MGAKLMQILMPAAVDGGTAVVVVAALFGVFAFGEVSATAAANDGDDATDEEVDDRNSSGETEASSGFASARVAPNAARTKYRSKSTCASGSLVIGARTSSFSTASSALSLSFTMAICSSERRAASMGAEYEKRWPEAEEGDSDTAPEAEASSFADAEVVGAMLASGGWSAPPSPQT